MGSKTNTKMPTRGTVTVFSFHKKHAGDRWVAKQIKNATHDRVTVFSFHKEQQGFPPFNRQRNAHNTATLSVLRSYNRYVPEMQ